MGGFRPSKNRWAITVASLAISAAALWFVLRSFEWPTFIAQARSLDRGWVAAAVLADILSYVCQGARWSYLLKPVVHTSIFSTTRAVYAGLFVNELLPMRPGEVVRGMIVSRHTGNSLTSIVPSMVAERVMDTVVLILAGIAAASYIRLPESVTEFLFIAGGMLLAVGAILVLVHKRIPSNWLEQLRNRPAMLMSFGVLLGQCVAVWCIVRACGIQLPLAAGFTIAVVLRIGTALPLAPANVGTHQLAMLLGLGIFGISGNQATDVALIVFAVLTLPLVILGAVAFATEPNTGLRACRASPPTLVSSSTSAHPL